MSKKEKIFAMIISFASLIQILYVYSNKGVWIQSDAEKVSIFKIINVGTYQVIQQLMNLFFPGISWNQEILNYNLLFTIIFILLIGLCLFLFYKNRDKESLMLLIFIALIFGTSYLNVLTRMWDGEYVWTTMIGSINTRHAILIKISYILILLLIPYCIKKMEEKKEGILLLPEWKNKFLMSLLLIFLLVRYSPKTTDDIFRYNDTFTDWKIYSKFYESGKYSIPIEPYIGVKNQKFYYIGSKTRNPSILITKATKFYLPELDNVEKISELNLPTPIKVEFLYVRRPRNYYLERAKILGFDENNNLVSEAFQLNKVSKTSVGFKVENPRKIKKIVFITEHGKIAHMIPEIMIGESLD